MDGLKRRSCGSVERHVAHVQPIIGTPWDVPVPSIKTLPWIIRQGYGVMMRDCGLLASTKRKRSS